MSERKRARAPNKDTSPPRPSNNGNRRPRKRTGRGRHEGDEDDRAEALSLTRLASEARERPVLWHWRPWIARGVLSFVVGQPGAGKSSFLAFLCSLAKSVVLLPGHEEPFDQMTKPRLRAHGVREWTVRVCDGRPWHLRANFESLLKIVRAVQADLVLFDPVDSYIDEGIHENDSQAVRPCLELAAMLAEQTGAAVVGTRHPGKDPRNTCPGGRAWKAIPRAVVELVEEPSDPPQRFIRAAKYSLGEHPAPLSFVFDRSKPGPPVFTPGKAVALELADLARDVPDRLHRSKIESACELLRFLLQKERMEVRDVFKFAEAERLSEDTVRRAAPLVGIDYKREGIGSDHRSYWSLKPAAHSSANGRGGSVRQSLRTSGQKPKKKALRPLVRKQTDTPPPPAAPTSETPPGG